MNLRVKILVASTALGVAAGALPATAQGVSGLVPHRAVYNLELKDANERAGITAMFGRMVYEFTGSECEGYRVNFRFVTQVDTGGEKRTTDQQSTTFEDLRNSRFEFSSKSYTDERLDKSVSGFAENIGGKTKVELMEPDDRALDLEAGRFPTQHMLEVIERARKGEHFFETRIFDGSENGDKALFTSTFVGSPIGVLPGDPDAENAGTLKSEKTWPVTIAYFDENKTSDALPTYRMSFKLYPNGVSRDLTMDYGDFVLKGNLVKLDMLPAEACAKQ
ncbi:cell envelope integrity EipB family protein [Rhizobium alvei]|uniref:Cell envelope integrity EipB family protein n=1 Tax=Rhizobium alvei TaxID=1132659 RepID=A0ABT8YK85_9HYPH|nr:cell envelope integrity EipB family protein [Rhizobium alvei]MDO6964070.1 cell envelope integrity EipB family protein [Rhizobium alvei]